MLPTAFRPRLHWSQSMHLILEILLPSCNTNSCSIALALTLQFWSIHPPEGELDCMLISHHSADHWVLSNRLQHLGFYRSLHYKFWQPPHWIRYGWTCTLDIRGYDWMTLAYFRPEMHVLVAMYDLVPRIAICQGAFASSTFCLHETRRQTLKHWPSVHSQTMLNSSFRKERLQELCASSSRAAKIPEFRLHSSLDVGMLPHWSSQSYFAFACICPPNIDHTLSIIYSNLSALSACGCIHAMQKMFEGEMLY